jgi:RNA polymerase sigma-70 factor (ECF subfamily)
VKPDGGSQQAAHGLDDAATVAAAGRSGSGPDPAHLRALIARCALREQAAFAELYRLSAAKLFAVAARILRRDDLAEEALQDSFVNIWNHCADYRPDLAAPMTWMTSIVRNRALDLKRRPALEVTGDDSDAWVNAFPDDAPGPLALLQDAGAARRLKDCLDHIEARQRQTIALAFMHGLTHTELSDHLHVPLGTIKTSIRRGLIRLKDCLGGTTGVDWR